MKKAYLTNIDPHPRFATLTRRARVWLCTRCVFTVAQIMGCDSDTVWCLITLHYTGGISAFCGSR